MLHILIKRDVNWTMRVNWRRLFWAPRRVLHMMVLVSRYKYHHNIDQECGRAPLYKTASIDMTDMESTIYIPSKSIWEIYLPKPNPIDMAFSLGNAVEFDADHQ